MTPLSFVWCIMVVMEHYTVPPTTEPFCIHITSHVYFFGYNNIIISSISHIHVAVPIKAFQCMPKKTNTSLILVSCCYYLLLLFTRTKCNSC
ncbi:hypothetical protein AAZX31_02G112700 [Glycine max]